MIFLRKINKKTKTETGTCLGETYVYESKDLIGNDRWSEILEKVLDWMKEDAKAKCFGVVYNEDGESTPLFHYSDNYLVTESGKTHAKLQ